MVIKLCNAKIRHIKLICYLKLDFNCIFSYIMITSYKDYDDLISCKIYKILSFCK